MKTIITLDTPRSNNLERERERVNSAPTSNENLIRRENRTKNAYSVQWQLISYFLTVFFSPYKQIWFYTSRPVLAQDYLLVTSTYTLQTLILTFDEATY